VYALTAKGEKELGGARTSLSPAEIELLVLTDGRSTVSRIRERTRILSADAVIETCRGLARGGWIEPAGDKKSDALDFADFFTNRAHAGSPAKALEKVKAEASNGVSTLQRHGYFVRIARRSSTGWHPTGDAAPVVVVVEDEPSLAKFLKQYLAFDGFDVRLAANRSEIVAELRRPPVPALVLLDVMLPDADGFDILLKMRQHPVLKSVPVIMLTAKATREAVQKGLAGGADGYVTKPFEAEVLIKAVHSVLGLPESPAADPLFRRGR
jgi:CheY-like chemotaxis protein